MNKQIIKTIIGERQAEIMQYTIVPRNIKIDSHANYVLVGPRRAGKSFTLYQDIQQKIKSGEAKIEDILFINFEDERLASLTAPELGLILDTYLEMYDNKRPFIYLDEIQNVDGWEKFARRLADSQYKVMITGSNAKMLSAEIATTLGGRYIPKEIFPFTFTEYLNYHGTELSKNWEYNPDLRITVKKHFNNYFHTGGFAETFDKQDKREWLNSLYQKILMGDIVERNKIRNARIFRLLVRKLADSVMQPLTLNRIQHIVMSSGDKISMPVMKDYLEYMEQSYLTFSIPNLTSHITEQATITKRYFIDNGILNLFLLNAETKLLENIVAIQLNRLFRNTEDELRLFYYSKGMEIDFCIPEIHLAIQVSYNIDDIETYEREVGNMVRFLKIFKDYQGIIITRDDERTISANGCEIKIIPIWKWLYTNYSAKTIY